MKPTQWIAFPLALALVSVSFGANADDAAPHATPPPAQNMQPAPPITPTIPNAAPTAGTPAVGTATTTSGEATITPMPSAPAPEPASHDTVTLYDKRRPNKPLLFTGGAIFLGSYVTTAVYTAANTDTMDKTLYLPAVGPWLALADSDYDTTKTVLVAGSGVLQGVGLALGIASFFVPEKKAAATIQAGNVKMNVVPASYGVGSAGVGAVGTF